MRHGRKWIRLAAAALAATAMMQMTAYGDGNWDMPPRDYPGWNGCGPAASGPIAGWISEDGFDDGEEPSDGPGANYASGWRYSPAGWWYLDDYGNWPEDRWGFIDNRWYRFSKGGHLITGWYQENDKWYYLNPVDDGTYGSMRTGWQLVNGKAYYFNPKADGAQGQMLAGVTTPDGYQVGPDGALIQ